VYFDESGISSLDGLVPTKIKETLTSATLRNNYDTIYIDCIDK
jgi:hypothetical protein